MIDIENTRVIKYGNNQSVTVYRDYSDPNLWYIVPEPVIAVGDNGLPEFALVQYTGDDGKVAGTCTFQTELQVSPEAMKAAQEQLGANARFGQFDWQSVNAVFIFSTASMANMELTATPSMYGANRASFVIHLPDQATVNDFINAFGPGGSAGGTFMLRYDVTALTRLPPATVTVQFNADTAYRYQRTLHETKNVWGHVTSRTAAVHEYLSQSEAGTVTVEPGGKPLDPATHQRLEAWGNATLENDVNQAVSAAMKVIGQDHPDNFTLSQVASFTNRYVEGQVVPWIITPRAPIPAFSKDVWSKVFSTVPNQTLAVAFTVQNLTENHVESIEVVVNYPTQLTGNTHVFTPQTPGTWVFTAPGNIVDGKYSPEYTYQYVVHYTDGGAPYKSPVLKSSDTAIYLDANDLNILQVTFSAPNVNFAGASNTQASAQNLVQYLLIDFYFVNEADGALVQDQQARLDATNTSTTFFSKTRLPFDNDYQYRLTYVLTDGQQVVINWTRGNVASVAGQKANAPVVTLNSPFQTRMVTLFLIPPAGGSYDAVELMATYSDPINNLNEQYTWQVLKDQAPDTWSFLAPANQNGQVIQYQGEYIIGGNQQMIQQAKTSMMFINISTTQQLFSVEVDPSQIEWSNGPITQVVLSIYTKDKTGAKSNIASTVFNPKNTGTYLYDFQFATGTTPVYYYTAQYWIKDQPLPRTIGETKVSGLGVLTLPGTAPGK